MGVLSRPVHDILPVELILEIANAIFSRGVGFPDIVRMSGVDKAMRNIVISYPLYWSSITLDINPSSATLAQICLERSQAKPLSLDIILATKQYPVHMKDILRVLIYSATRLKSLTIKMMTSRQFEAIDAMLLRLRTPELESLFVASEVTDQSREEIQVPKAPRMTSMTLAGVLPALFLKPIYTGLTSLRLKASHGSALNTNKLVVLLWSVSELEILHFEGQATSLITADRYQWPHSKYELHCPNLRLLSIIHADEPFVHQFFIYLRAPLLETVKLDKPLKGTNHAEEISNEIHGGFQSGKVPSVRNLIIYNLAEDHPERDTFTMWAMMTFPSIYTVNPRPEEFPPVT